MLPDRNPILRAEVVHESEHTRVTRLVLAGRTIIRKEPLGPDAESRFQHEQGMLERLSGVDGVAQLVKAPRYAGSIVLEDVGGISLAELAKPLAVDELIRLALGLAGAVAEMHRRGVMHRNITPANIVVSAEGAPCLVDFALATSATEIRPQFTHHSEIVGTLAYLSPEQTGRTGRSVDQRADLYGLGATLYELATGGPPFDSADPLQLTHDHLARIPESPTAVNPAVPAAMSDIILHLLEKEPDQRYQTADGVAYDLERVRDLGASESARLRVGEHDIPLRLVPPSRLVGRDGEVAVLRAAFEEALQGRCRGVLISGMPGVGKTVLADELRPIVTVSAGWFVVGKFDQYRRDLEFDAIHQAFRALGRLLLAEPEEELAEIRDRILQSVGANAGLLSAAVPELGALLGVPPEPGDPLTAQGRAQRTAVQVLRAVASRKQPVVLFVDDLQWAGRTPLGVVDLVLSEEPLEGLLLVGAYRKDDVDGTHPLAAMVSRWHGQAGVQHLALDNLSAPTLVTMVAEMLHIEPAAAAGLTELIEAHTSGNPYETVELLNALRRDGLLAVTADGWQWEEAAVRVHLSQFEVAGLLAANVGAVPPTSRQMVEAMACLGGRAELGLLQTATGESARVVDQALAPALHEGVVAPEPGGRQAVRFRHDRTREVVLGAVDPHRRRALQLAMARRLAEVPELFAVAAEQYLTVIGAVDDPTERRRAVELLRRAAEQAALTGDHALVNALLAGALRLLGPDETAMLIEVHTARHAALYSIGRLDEADEEYRSIETLCPTALPRAAAIAVQVRSLTHRNRIEEALSLGVKSLRELGITVPAADRLPAEIDRQFGYFYRWLDQIESADALTRPEISDPTTLAALRLLNAVLPATYYSADHMTQAWLSLEMLRIWLEQGPSRTLAGATTSATFIVLALRDDYDAAYRALRRMVALGEARGYEPETSQARYVLGVLGCWFEPLESTVQATQRAREGLIAGGDLANAGYTYHPGTVTALLDCGLTLDVYVAEVEAASAFARRTGSEQLAQLLDSCRWIGDVLRGNIVASASEANSYADNPLALVHAHLSHAKAAAIFGDPVALARHTAAAEPLLPAIVGTYPMAWSHLLRGLALAGQARTSDGGERDVLLSELDEVTQWLAARAEDAPDNFLHLLRLLEAERAWAVGDFRAAVLAFDSARREVAGRQRPWHRALIAERTARFFLAHGAEQTGYEFLVHAREEYAAWGATAKVSQLDWTYPTLRRPNDTTAPDASPAGGLRYRSATVTTGTIDLLGILSASQALSSETSVDRVHARVTQVLSAITGATRVQLLLWSDDRQTWLLPAADGDAAPAGLPAHEPAVPMSVLRYVQRMREPLVVRDVVDDDRFARDPYFADAACSSLLALPILSRGMLRAALVLENRLIRGAFTAERLDAVRLIAGQLAVSLDNAQLYAEHRRLAAEQAALRRVATLVARGVPPQEVFATVATEAGRLLDAHHAHLFRYDADSATLVALWGGTAAALSVGTRLSIDGRNMASLVLQTGRPARIDDYAASSGPVGDHIREFGIRSAVGVPVSVEGRLWGVVVVGSAHEGPLPAGTEERLADFTDLAATAIANAEAHAELTTSRARIVATADHTRRQIERDLHDGAQQRLVTLALQLRSAKAAIPPQLDTFGAQLDRAVAQANGALEDLREIARGLHPAILAKGGLGPALRVLARRSPIPVQLSVSVQGTLPEHVEISAYYIVAEALTNTAKHARASAATVAVDVAGDALCIEVRDDGTGGASFAGGTGLLGLKDRIEAFGGRFFLQSVRGEGTTLRAELPFHRRERGVVS